MDIIQLQKEVKILEQRKFELNNAIQNLSNEKIKYLEEIPKSKKWAEDQAERANIISVKTDNLVKELNSKNQDLKDINSLIVQANKDLNDLKDAHASEIPALEDRKLEIINRTKDIKDREVALNQRLAIAEDKERKNLAQDNINESKLLDISKKQKEYIEASQYLESNRKSLTDRENEHVKNESLFNENKKDYINKQDILKYKLEQANVLIKDNEKLKRELEFQKKSLKDATDRMEERKLSLHNNILALNNREKELQIKDLRIRKLAHEAGLDKELAELQGK